MPQEKDVVGLLLIGGAVASILLLTRGAPGSSQPVASTSSDPGVDPGGGTSIGKPLPPQTTPYPANQPLAGTVSAGILQQPAQSQPTTAQLFAAAGTTSVPTSGSAAPPSGSVVYPGSYLGSLPGLGSVRQVGLPITSNLQVQANAAARAGVIPVVSINGIPVVVSTPGGPPGMSVPQIQYLTIQSQQLSAGIRATQAQQRAATTQLAATLANVPIVGPAIAAQYQQQVAAATLGQPAARPGINYAGQPYGILSRRTYSPPAPAAPAAAAPRPTTAVVGAQIARGVRPGSF